MKMNLTTPLEMPGDTLGCQLKKLELLSRRTVLVGSQESCNRRSIQCGEEGAIKENSQIMRQIWGKQDRLGVQGG